MAGRSRRAGSVRLLLLRPAFLRHPCVERPEELALVFQPLDFGGQQAELLFGCAQSALELLDALRELGGRRPGGALLL